MTPFRELMIDWSTRDAERKSQRFDVCAYFDSVKDKIKLVSREDYAKLWADNPQPPPLIGYMDAIYGQVTQIVIDKDAFYVDHEDYSDLTVYSLFHEVMEAITGKIDPHMNTDRRHEISLYVQLQAANSDGNLGRMLEFNRKSFRAYVDHARRIGSSNADYLEHALTREDEETLLLSQFVCAHNPEIGVFKPLFDAVKTWLGEQPEREPARYRSGI